MLPACCDAGKATKEPTPPEDLAALFQLQAAGTCHLPQVPRHRIYCALLCRLSGLPWDLIVTDMCFMEKNLGHYTRRKERERAQEEEGKRTKSRSEGQGCKEKKRFCPIPELLEVGSTVLT